MALQRDTVAIPVARGINVNTPARLVDAQELLEARNVRVTAATGARKRRGHNGQKIRGAKALPGGWTQPQFTRSTFVAPYYTGNRNIFADWLLGYGYAPSTEVTDASLALPSSSHPDGIAYGMAQRDDETLVWDGNRLLSRTSLDLPGGQFAEFNAVMPTLNSEAFAKANVAQSKPDVADNGTIRVAAWVTNTTPYYSVFDSTTGTLITGPNAIVGPSAAAVRTVPVGDWVHIFISDADTQTIQLRSIHRSTPLSLSSRTLGDCNGYFDVWKESDTSLIIAQSQTTAIQVRYLDADGSLIASKNWSADTGGATGITAVAVCTHPTTTKLGLAWRTATQVQARCYTSTGTTTGTVKTLGTITTATRAVAIAPKYLLSGGEEVFNVYWDDYATARTTNIARFAPTPGVLYSASTYHLLLGSQAFRVGDRTFIWAARNSTYQSGWVLLDEKLKSVGKAEYAVANTPTQADLAKALPSVNWYGTAPAKDRCVYHCALSTRVRVPVEPTTAGINPPAVYSEPYIKFVQLDFLPRLRSAQAGRTTYFAGAQLWAYDGAELTESNFVFAPEDITVENDVTVGDLVSDGHYIYRVDLCYRNAQNEEIRSASFYTSMFTLTGGTSLKLTIPTTLTRRENAYFLIFRNENNGTVWYLANSRDPSSPLFLRNDQSVAQVTYVDSSVSDAELISREQHPNQSFDHLDPFAAPACEVISAGANRLWLAGGEIEPGQVYPSRLFRPGEVPAFHNDLAVQVDRNAEEITAIGFVGEATVFFRKTHNYILDPSGIDNEGNGDWTTPRRSLTDIGAVSQESVATISGGIVFQSPAGFRMFTPGGGLAPIGLPVDKIAKTLNVTAAVVVGADQEVRFYGWDGLTLVYNYQYNSWSTWDIAAAGAIKDPSTNLAVIATPFGTLLREADGIWTDDSQVYKMRIRFAWLHAGGVLDWQQVRRIGAVGEAAGEHKIHVDVYYNEREFAEETFDWDYPESDQNLDTFGSGSFGDGSFGDTGAVEGIQFRDSTWAWRRRLHRRKCSVISIAIDDAYTNGEGFCLTALALELAKKPGLDRIPWRGGTYNNTGGSGSSNTGN